MKNPTRRRFLQGGLATAGLAATSLPARAQTSGANTDLRVAVIGCGGKGKGHLKSLLGAEGVRVAGVCDVDQAHLDDVVERTKKAGQQGLPPKGYLDYRELVEDPDIDSVIIATPNHLHTTIAVRAIAAGKHVYVEKPVSHNIWEGRKLIEAAQFASGKGLIVQHGMQRRSDTGWHEAMEWLADKDCPIGKVTLSRGLCYKARQSIGKVDGPQQPPEGVNYDLWSGPREMLPIRRERFHYDWHWQWPYGNGDIGNQGPHQMDVARWPLTNTTVAPRVISIGGRFGYDDDGTTANTQIAYFDFKPAPLIFEVCGLPNSGLDWKKGMPAYKGTRIGNIIHCEGGYIAESKAYDADGKSIHKFGITNGRGHLDNWLNAIRTGRHDTANWGAETGHLAAALCHQANISYQLGKKMKPGAIKEQIKGNTEFTETFERMKEHLAQNGIQIAKDQAIAGPMLSMNPNTERFTGELAEEANKYVKEDYREGYEVLEIA